MVVGIARANLVSLIKTVLINTTTGEEVKTGEKETPTRRLKNVVRSDFASIFIYYAG